MKNEIKNVLKSLKKSNKEAIFKIVDGKVVCSVPASKLRTDDGYYIHEGIIMKGDFEVGKFVYDKNLESDLFSSSSSIGNTDEIDSNLENTDTNNKSTGPKVLPNVGSYTMPKKEIEEESDEDLEEIAEELGEEENEPKEKKHRIRNFVKRAFFKVRLSISNFLEKNNSSFEIDDEKYLKDSAKSPVKTDVKDEKKEIFSEIRDYIKTIKSIFENNNKMFNDEHFDKANKLIERYNSSKRDINTISVDQISILKNDFNEFYNELNKYLSDKKAKDVSEKMNSVSPKENINKKVSVDDMGKDEKEMISNKLDEVENKVNKIEYKLLKNNNLKELYGDEFSILRDRFDSIAEDYDNGNYSERLMSDLEKVESLSDVILKEMEKVSKKEETNSKARKQPKVVKAKLIRNEVEEMPKATIIPKTVFDDSEIEKIKDEIEKEIPKVEKVTPVVEEQPTVVEKVIPVVEEQPTIVEMPKVETIEEKIAKAQNKLPELERMLEEVKVSLEVCEEADKEYFTEKKEKIEKVINDIKTASRRSKVEEYAKNTVFRRENEALIEKQEAEKREDSRRALEASNEFYRNEYISYWESLSDDDLSPYSNVPAKKLDEVLSIKSKIRELQNKKNEILAGKEKISIYDDSISDEDIIKLRHIGMGLKTLSNKELEVINRVEKQPEKTEYIWNKNTKHFIKK